MKNYFNYLKFLVFSTTIIVISCEKDEESYAYRASSQKNIDYTANEKDIFEMASFFSEKNKWILVDVNFLRAEDDPEIEIGKNEIDGLLVFDYFNSENEEIIKTGYLDFKKIGPNRFVLIPEFGNSCSGVNCSKCKLNRPWFVDKYCSCEKIGHPDGGVSYCNHSTSSITYLTALTTSHKEISKLILDEPESLIQEVKDKLNQ